MTDTRPPPFDEPADEQCVLHMTDFDPDCGMCKSELVALQFELRNNTDANQLVERRLAAMGRPVSTLNLLAIRLNTLIESACGGNPKTRTKFELTFMVNLAGALHDAEQEAVRARLLVPHG